MNDQSRGRKGASYSREVPVERFGLISYVVLIYLLKLSYSRINKTNLPLSSLIPPPANSLQVYLKSSNLNSMTKNRNPMLQNIVS
jgi:hypothetical protein